MVIFAGEILSKQQRLLNVSLFLGNGIVYSIIPLFSTFQTRSDNGRKKEQQDNEKLQAELYQQIGKLKVELDWLKKKVGLLS
jgi:hypothetical protein